MTRILSCRQGHGVPSMRLGNTTTTIGTSTQTSAQHQTITVPCPTGFIIKGHSMGICHSYFRLVTGQPRNYNESRLQRQSRHHHHHPQGPWSMVNGQWSTIMPEMPFIPSRLRGAAPALLQGDLQYFESDARLMPLVSLPSISLTIWLLGLRDLVHSKSGPWTGFQSLRGHLPFAPCLIFSSFFFFLLFLLPSIS